MDNGEQHFLVRWKGYATSKTISERKKISRTQRKLYLPSKIPGIVLPTGEECNETSYILLPLKYPRNSPKIKRYFNEIVPSENAKILHFSDFLSDIRQLEVGSTNTDIFRAKLCDTALHEPLIFGNI